MFPYSVLARNFKPRPLSPIWGNLGVAPGIFHDLH